MKELLTVEEFETLARQNPDEAENYIYSNQEELENAELIEQFDNIVDYWYNAWHWEAFERAQAQAFHERMDYR